MSQFRTLHQKGNPFVLVNVWDKGSAQVMAALGAKALATSSSAHGFTLGRPYQGYVSRDESLAHAQDIMSATDLPVSGDFENGFGDDPETCAETVRLSAEIGLAVICIEDEQLPSGGAYEFDLAVERVRAAASAAKAYKNDFFFVARADGMMNGAIASMKRSGVLRRLALTGYTRRCPPHWMICAAFARKRLCL